MAGSQSPPSAHDHDNSGAAGGCRPAAFVGWSVGAFAPAIRDFTRSSLACRHARFSNEVSQRLLETQTKQTATRLRSGPRTIRWSSNLLSSILRQ
jgi:hypothetical protein